MAEEETTPARTDDDAQKSKEDVAEQGHDTSASDDADSEATGAGPSGGAPESTDAPSGGEAAGDGPTGGAPE